MCERVSYGFQVIEAEVALLREQERKRLIEEYDHYRRQMEEMRASRQDASVPIQPLSLWRRFFNSKGKQKHTNM